MMSLLVFIFLISKILNLQCGDENIENCLVCGTGENNNTCAKCADNHFLFLFNYLCLPCDHLYYGDVGCKGNCYIKDNLDVTCDEFGCKDGYYSLDKMTCWNCNSVGTLNCGKCTNLPPEGKLANETDERIFKCVECINNNYRINYLGKCELCYVPNCRKCHYLENSNEAVCDSCISNYYVRNGNCVQCTKKYIYGGKCTHCTDDPTDYNNIYCYCNSGYYSKSNQCYPCPSNCDYCKYDNNLNKSVCLSCYIHYVLDEGTCKYCGRGCDYCYLDKNKNPICSICSSGYENDNGKCVNCPSNCAKCHLENDEYKCDRCIYQYTFNSQNQCVSCPSNCTSCEFNSNGKLICTACYVSYKYDIYYALNSESLCELCPSQCNNCFLEEISK